MVSEGPPELPVGAVPQSDGSVICSRGAAPSGEKVTLLTPPVWPQRVLTTIPADTSQTRTMASLKAAATVLPLGSKLTPFAQSGWRISPGLGMSSVHFDDGSSPVRCDTKPSSWSTHRDRDVRPNSVSCP